MFDCGGTTPGWPPARTRARPPLAQGPAARRRPGAGKAQAPAAPPNDEGIVMSFSNGLPENASECAGIAVHAT